MQSLRHVLFVPAALTALLAAALPAHAQSETGNAAAGRAIYEDTPGASGVPTLTGSCVNCHTSVVARRQKISGDTGAYPQVRFDQAMARLSYALNNVGAMRQFQALSAEDVRDLGAYLADTTQVDVDELEFTVATVNSTSAPQPVTVKAASLTPAGVVLKKVEIVGSGVGNYSRTYTCDNKVFAAGESCTFSVTFSPRDATNAVPVLTLTLADSATAPTYTRRVLLDGRVTGGGTTPPPAAAPDTSDSGGGAAGWELLAALAAAAGALGLRRRS